MSIAQDKASKKKQKLIKTKSRYDQVNFLYGHLAHEINTPLSVIYFANQMLKKGPQEKYHESIEDAIDRIVKILDALKEYQELGSHDESKTSDLDAIVESIRDFTQKENIKLNIKTNYDPELKINANSNELLKAVKDLAENAKKFGNGDVQITLEKDRPFFYIKVIDNGSGLSKTIEENLDSPFNNDYKFFKSKGKGLSKALLLAHINNCDLHYQRKKDKTKFKLEIPLQKQID